MNRDSPGTPVYTGPARRYCTEPGALLTPPMYAVFDCLYLRGQDLRGMIVTVRFAPDPPSTMLPVAGTKVGFGDAFVIVSGPEPLSAS
jgi:hypothetical protein